MSATDLTPTTTIVTSEPIARAAIQRRWTLAYGVYSAATNLTFTQAIWVIYLATRGYSPFAIGLFEMTFHLAKFLAEAPTGVFADLVGRRASLIVAALLAFGGELLFLTPTGPLIALSFALQGVAFAFRGGADSALLWTLVERSGAPDKTARYSSMFSRMFLVVIFAQTLAVAGGGALGSVQVMLPFVCSAVAYLLSVAPLLLLPEKRVAAHERPRPLAHFVAGLRASWRDPVLLGLLLLSGLTAGVVTTIGYYTQLYFHTLGFSLAAVGLVIGATIVPDAFFAASAPRIMRWLPKRWVLGIFVGAEALGLLLMTVSQPILAIVGYGLLLHAGDSVLYPAISTYLNERSPEAQRATVLSLETGLFSALMIVLFPLFGLGLTHIAYNVAYLLTFVLLVGGSLGIVALVGLLRRRAASASV
jgi:MFS family permease